MKPVSTPFTLLLCAALFAGCRHHVKPPAKKTEPVVEQPKESAFATARKKFKTKLLKHNQIKTPAPKPPKDVFSIVEYPTSIGAMKAYLGKIPDDGKLHPAIIWIGGGFGNDIWNVWSEAPVAFDETAAAFRKEGLVMMYPSQRGANGNPGYDESCFGEIDDILAALDFLVQQKGIDPKHIYLGGHSTGGTKALLVAECTDRFRAVFAFGPVVTPLQYNVDDLTYEYRNKEENLMRAPGLWLTSIKSPVFIIEGEGGNIEPLRVLKQRVQKKAVTSVQCIEVKGKDHFSVLQPVERIIAKKIMKDDQQESINLNLSENGLNNELAGRGKE